MTRRSFTKLLAGAALAIAALPFEFQTRFDPIKYKGDWKWMLSMGLDEPVGFFHETFVTNKMLQDIHGKLKASAQPALYIDGIPYYWLQPN